MQRPRIVSADDEALNEATKSYCPKNTLANNKWAVKNFSEWIEARQKKTDVQKNSYEEILFTHKASELSYWLSAFVKETRKTDGSEYTPKTLYMLIAGLQREIRLHKQSGQAFNLFQIHNLKAFKMFVTTSFEGCTKKDWEQASTTLKP